MLFTTYHLFLITLAYIAGVAWTPHVMYSFAMLCIILYAYRQEKNPPTILLLLACAFCSGTTRYYQQKTSYEQDLHLLDKKADITAQVIEILPRLDEDEDICITLYVSCMSIDNTDYQVHKKIYLYVPYYTKIWLKPFQKIIIKNIIVKHPRSTSFAQYLIRENIWAVAHQKWLSYTTIKKPHLLREYCDQLLQLSLTTASQHLSTKAHTLYLSIFCGKKIKSPVTDHFKKLFQRWGISHHLARSGLHLVILLSLLFFLFSWVPCPLLYKEWLMVFILVVYYLLTYPSIAFIRAFCMYLVYTLCKQFYLPTKPLHILLVTTLCVLVTNPYHLFFLDFQLSFGITLLIMWFLQHIQNRKTIASS